MAKKAKPKDKVTKSKVVSTKKVAKTKAVSKKKKAGGANVNRV